MLKQFSKTIVVGVTCVAAVVSGAGLVRALDPASKDPRAIMHSAFNQGGSDRTLVRLKMTIRDKLGTRERVLALRSMSFDQGRKSLILIEQPADVRNTGFLSIDYRAADRTDEQWLYLPQLHRVSRVPGSGKSESFVGSDFTYADLSQSDPDDYELKLLEASVRVGDEECWLIESVPRTDNIKQETGYTKRQIWLSKSKLIPIQVKAWMIKDNKVKYFKATDLRQTDGLWTAQRVQMRTLQNEVSVSETLLEVLSIKNHAAEVNDLDFTVQRLERGF